MAANEALKARVQAALARIPRVQEKKMFGGVTFMVRGKMCISVGAKRLMCRIDPAIHDRAVARSGVRPVRMNGRVYRGFVHVDAAVVKTKRQLDSWVGLALAYNKRLR